MNTAVANRVEFTVDQEFKEEIQPLTEEERQRLEESLVAEGCRDPLVVWKEEGILLDGHNRYEICERLAIPFKIVKISLADRTAAKIWILKNQLGRRNLSQFSYGTIKLRLKPLLEEQAKARQRGGQGGVLLPPNSAEAIDTRSALDALPGPKHNTLDAIEKVLETGSVKLIEAANQGTISVSAAAEIATLPKKDQADVVEKGKAGISAAVKEIKRKKAEARKAERAARKAEAVKKNHPLKGKSFRLIHGDLEKVGKEIADNSVDAIITDPPYPEEFLPVYEKLAHLAARVLVNGGHCLVMVGQSHLPAVLTNLCCNPELTYHWTLAYLTPGQSTQVFGRHVKSNWKPVLWLIKGKNTWEHVEDSIKSDENDKRFHEWGQSVGGLAQLVERFTVKKSTILDPFVGGGSTAVAALKLDRLFVGIDIDAACIQQTAERIKKIEELE